MKGIYLFVFIFGFYCNQNSKTTAVKAGSPAEYVADIDQMGGSIYSQHNYKDAKGKHVIIQNGYPKGGNLYTDSRGKQNGYAVFWSRVINETDKPLDFDIKIPDDLHEISNFPGKYLKLLVAADTFTENKLSMVHYGLGGIDTFLDKNFDKTTSVKRSIRPKERSGFYFVLLIMTAEATGMTRTELKFNGQQLVYKISRFTSNKPITLIDEIEIPCGSLGLKDLKLVE